MGGVRRRRRRGNDCCGYPPLLLGDEGVGNGLHTVHRAYQHHSRPSIIKDRHEECTATTIGILCQKRILNVQTSVFDPDGSLFFSPIRIRTLKTRIFPFFAFNIFCPYNKFSNNLMGSNWCSLIRFWRILTKKVFKAIKQKTFTCTYVFFMDPDPDFLNFVCRSGLGKKVGSGQKDLDPKHWFRPYLVMTPTIATFNLFLLYFIQRRT